MRALLLLLCGCLTAAAQTYPSTPINHSIGALRCGVRMFTAASVQTWCYSGGKVVHNTIHTVAAGTAVVTGYIQGNDQIIWLINLSGVAVNCADCVAITPNSGVHVNWQVATSTYDPVLQQLATVTCQSGTF